MMDYGGLCGFSVAVADRVGARRSSSSCRFESSFVPRRSRSWRCGSSVGVPETSPRRTEPRWSCNAVVGGLKETLELLIASAVVVPLFKRFNLSPVLGFLAAGVALGPHGLRLVTELDDIAQIADIGVLFLLFEMGLELSIDRLKKLRVYAFGLGTLQMALTSTALAAGALMMGAGISESLVIGTSLSLSSSAFVLQLLAERKEQSSRYATAAFGVLLLQDIAVVPLLVLVPLLSTTEWTGFQQIEGLITAILATAAKAVAGVFAVVVGGGFVLRPVFRFVSESRSAEAFTSVVLATVLGAGFITNELGLSMTLGAFIAGVLLSESSYRSRIQVDIEPFRGLLLGLFFITTGMSMDISVFLEQPLETAALIASLIAVKSTILGLLARPFNLSAPESAKLGLILGQGGEFGFVLFALANKLGFLPDDVNKILVVVIVSSMALTPLMAEIGAKLAPIIQGPQYSEVEEEERERELVKSQTRVSKNVVIIIGYGEVGHLVVDMLSRKFIPFIVIDKNESLVRDATLQGVPCVCADAEQHGFLNDHGITSPTAVVLTMNSSRIATGVVNNMQVENPEVPIYVRARDMRKMNRLKNLGVVATYPETLESSLALAEEVMRGYGIPDQDVRSIAKSLRNERGFDELKRIKKRIRADALGDFDPEVKREVTELVIVDREKMKELNDQKLRKEK